MEKQERNKDRCQKNPDPPPEVDVAVKKPPHTVISHDDAVFHNTFPIWPRFSEGVLQFEFI